MENFYHALNTVARVGQELGCGHHSRQVYDSFDIGRAAGAELAGEVLAAHAEAVRQLFRPDWVLDFVQEQVPGGALQGLGQAEKPRRRRQRGSPFGREGMAGDHVAEYGIVYAFYGYRRDGMIAAGKQKIAVIGTEGGVRDDRDGWELGAQGRELAEEMRLRREDYRIDQT